MLYTEPRAFELKAFRKPSLGEVCPHPSIDSLFAQPQRWQDAVRTLLDLQDGYRAWLDHLPDNLQESALAHQLEAICGLDLAELESIEPPRGFGRD